MLSCLLRVASGPSPSYQLNGRFRPKAVSPKFVMHYFTNLPSLTQTSPPIVTVVSVKKFNLT